MWFSRLVVAALAAASTAHALPQIADATTSAPDSGVSPVDPPVTGDTGSTDGTDTGSADSTGTGSTGSIDTGTGGSGSDSGNSTGKPCNNSPKLCGRQYNTITHAGVHDSAFLRDASTDNSIAGNQFLNATKALDAGFRLLQAQIHDKDGTQQLCHTSCTILDGGPLEDWLAAIAEWVKANSNEVVTILLVNSDSASTTDLASTYKKAGLDKLSFKAQKGGADSPWPTLQTMIDQDTRVVNFIADIKTNPDVPFLLNQFNYVFETAFEVTSLDGFNCTLDRPSSQSDAATALSHNRMPLMNHFKYKDFGSGIQVPDVDNIDELNDAGSSAAGNLGKHADLCKKEWGTQPTFFLVDFWNKGDPLAVTDKMNGVSDATDRKEFSSDDAPDDDESSGNGRERNIIHGALVAFVAAAVLLL